MAMVPPLEGLRVLEVATFLAAPLAASLLADWGAEVVKVEPGAGDPTRWLEGAWLEQGMTPLFAAANRGKRAIAVDLSGAEGRGVVASLAAKADVVIHNHSPAIEAKLGLDTESLVAGGSNAVVCSVSAFGPEGTYAGRPALDPVIQALTGMAALTGVPDGEPMRSASPVVDVCTGMTAAAGVLASLMGRERTGVALPVQVALFDVGMLFNTSLIVERSATGETPPRLGNRSHPLLADQFAAADGFVVFAVWDERRWAALCRELGLDALGVDPAWSSNHARLAGYSELRPKLAAAIVRRPAAALRDALLDAGITCAVTADLDAVAADPHVLSSGAVYAEDRLGPRPVTMAAGPLRLAGRRPLADLPPPRLAEHSRAVMTDWLEAQDLEIDTLIDRGAIVQRA